MLRPLQGWLIASACLCAVGTNVQATEIWVVCDSAHPVAGAQGARLIELDAPARILSAFAGGLPSDRRRATQIAQQRLTGGGKQLQQRLALAYQGITDAWSLGITKIPAVIVDRQYVVYGESDVRRAVAKIEHFRSSGQ